MTTGDRIRYLRNKEKLSQVELAKRIGASKQTLYKYENGIITNIPSDKIELLAEVLHATPAFIMGWDNTIPVSHMDRMSNILSIAEKSGIDAGEIIGCPGLLPEDYEGKNLRVHEVKKRYHDRTGKATAPTESSFSDTSKEYYEDPETARRAQAMYEDRDMRMLYDMKQRMTPERFARQMETFRDMYRLEHPEEFPEDWTD